MFSSVKLTKKLLAPIIWRQFRALQYFSTTINNQSINIDNNKKVSSSKQINAIKNSQIHIHNKPLFKFSTSTSSQSPSMIQSLQQIQKGNEYFRKTQYSLAINQFQMSLKFLPSKIQNNPNYTIQYEQLLQKLLQSHVKSGKTITSYLQHYKQYFNINSSIYKFINILSRLQISQSIQKLSLLRQQLQQNHSNNKLWSNILRAFIFKSSAQCYGKHLPLLQISKTNDMSLKYVGLFLYQKIKNRQNKQREDIYLNSCRQLLKQSQKYTQYDIIKPLSLTASNLLAGDQFLQAEGLLSHCLAKLEQYYQNNQNNLKIDQKYVHYKLLMARIYSKVRRQIQSQRIIEEYQKLWSQKTFVIQEIIDIKYSQI